MVHCSTVVSLVLLDDDDKEFNLAQNIYKRKKNLFLHVIVYVCLNFGIADVIYKVVKSVCHLPIQTLTVF